MKKPLRFLHIPKTAGTTFTGILHRQHFNQLCFSFTESRGREDLLRFSEDKIRSIGLYTGHAPIEIGIDWVDGVQLVTFLRDPVQRVKSFCQYVAIGGSPYLGDTYSKDFNLDTFLKSGNLELYNLQTRMLINGIDVKYTECMSDDEMVDMAFDNLCNRVKLFGMQQYFDESLVVFASALNWELPVYRSKNTKSQNVQTKNRLVFEKRHEDMIRELNRLDIELFDRALNEFRKKIADKSFDRQMLVRLRKVNSQAGMFGVKKLYDLLRGRKPAQVIK